MPNGLLVIQSFVSTTDNCFGGISAIGPNAFVASATENMNNPKVDILVGIPAGSNASAGSLKGLFTAGYIDFLGANIATVRQASFNATADGAGNFATFGVTGSAVNLGDVHESERVGCYLHTRGRRLRNGQFRRGEHLATDQRHKEFLYSSDGGIILGGSPLGYDLLVGIRGLTSPATNATNAGVYYVAALEDSVNTSASPVTHLLDAYYGSTNATGAGAAISHNRIQSFAYPVYDFTYDAQYSVPPSGAFNDGQFYITHWARVARLLWPPERRVSIRWW